MHLTMVPGIGGSNDEHWQSRWQAGASDMSRISPSSWDDPNLQNWMNALDAAAGSRHGDTILVAHSLGCLLVASENDPYCTLPGARVLAGAWGIPVIDAGPLTHINDESGIGGWRQGRDLLTAFAAGQIGRASCRERVF